MRILNLVVLVLSLGCACIEAEPDATSPADAGADAADVPVRLSDAGRDVDPDVVDVGRPDARVRDVGPDAPRGHTPRMRVLDDSPCEPWEPVASPMARELPSDPSPRVLWTYNPGDDPNYEPVRARFESRVGSPVVSPDGTIWVKGPGYDLITQLNRDGTMREWFVVGGGENEDTRNSQRLGHLSVAPNGHVLAIIYTENPEQRGIVVRIDPDSPAPHDAPTTTSPNPGFQLDANSRLAISPDGMVYAISQNRVYGLCRGERHMWTLTNIAAAGEREFFQSGHFGGVFVQPDGTLQLSGSFAYTYEVRGTAVSSDLLFESVNELFYRQIAARTSDRVLLQATDPTLDGSARFHVGVMVAPNEWRAERSVPGYLAMNPLGEVHLLTFGGMPYRWEAMNDVRAPLAADIAVGDGAWQANGGWLTAFERDGVEGLYSLDIAGETRWAFNPVEEGDRGLVLGGQERILDDQGVYYRTVGVGGQFVQLIAVQTDVLPPPNTMCLDYYGCNAHRDRYLRPE